MGIRVEKRKAPPNQLVLKVQTQAKQIQQALGVDDAGEVVFVVRLDVVLLRDVLTEGRQGGSG